MLTYEQSPNPPFCGSLPHPRSAPIMGTCGTAKMVGNLAFWVAVNLGVGSLKYLESYVYRIAQKFDGGKV